VAQSSSVEVAGLCNVSRVTVEPQVGINGHAKRLVCKHIDMNVNAVRVRTGLVLGSVPDRSKLDRIVLGTVSDRHWYMHCDVSQCIRVQCSRPE